MMRCSTTMSSTTQLSGGAERKCGNALLVLLPLLLLLLTGCPQRATIADIQQDPGRYRDKDVVLQGTVTQSFGALGQGVYEIDDGTGRLWVLAEQGGVPSRGAEVEVEGRVVGGVTFAGRNYATALRERRHRAR